MSAFAELPGLQAQAIWDGVVARSVHGERITLALVELEPGSIVPEHSHEHEQLGFVLTGSVTFRVGEEETPLGPGGAWRIESKTPHEVHAGPEGAVVVDVFAPTRDDWSSAEAVDREPRWP